MPLRQRFAFPSLAAFSAGAVVSCAAPPDPSLTAGTVGECVELEVRSGYTTCVMNAPQQRNSGGNGRLVTAGSHLPVAVNHRSYLDLCVAIRDQGPCGFSVALGTTAAMEAEMCRRRSVSQRLSEPHIWHRGGSDLESCRGGWTIEDAFTTVAKSTRAGVFVAPSTLWRYQPDATAMRASMPDWRRLAEGGRHGFIEEAINYVPPRDVGELKRALASGRDVVYGVPVYECTGWFHEDGCPEEGAISALPADAVGDPLGHHAILIVGYDDAAGGWFDLLNSWGVPWADAGFGRISYQAIEQSGEGGLYFTDLIVESPEPLADLPSRVDAIVSRDDLEALRSAGLAIYLGENPPDLGGEFLADALVVRYDDDLGYAPGVTVSDLAFAFWNQSASGNVMVTLSDAPGNEASLKAVVTGDAGCFSVFIQAERAGTCETRPPRVFSGCLTGQGIVDLTIGAPREDDQSFCDAVSPRRRILSEADGIAGRR